MLKIFITVEDESLDYLQKGEGMTFEMATEHLAALERHYAARVALEPVEKETDF